MQNRFMRTETLLGKEAMQKLQNSTVMIVGLGAVGGYALEAVARSGIGRLVLVDFDVFDETNINRQILALSSTIGQKKTEVAKKRVFEINPTCKVEIKDLFVNEETIENLFDERPDFVIDAIDSLNSKCALIQKLCEEKIPFVSSMGAALKTDVSKIKIGTLDDTKNCTLAKFVRRRLRKRGINLKKIKCVFSEENSPLSKTALIRNDGDDRVRNILGSLPTITAIFGLCAANEAIMFLAGNEGEK